MEIVSGELEMVNSKIPIWEMSELALGGSERVQTP